MGRPASELLRQLHIVCSAAPVVASEWHGAKPETPKERDKTRHTHRKTGIVDGMGLSQKPHILDHL